MDSTHAPPDGVQAARAASPDGRGRGRFRQKQPTQPHTRSKRRKLLVALVLVCGLGLSSQQAAAQVQKAGKAAPVQPTSQRPAQGLEDLELEALQPAPPPAAREERRTSGGYPEVKPMPPGGINALLAYFRQNLRYPADTTVTGKVFVSFVVTKTGAITQAKVVNGLGLGPDFDAEALRLVEQMPAWQPARHLQQPVDCAYVLPVRFGPPPPKEPTAKQARQQQRTTRRRH